MAKKNQKPGHPFAGYLTIRQASERSGIPVYMIRASARTGAVPHTRVGTQIFIEESVFDEYAKKHPEMQAA